MNWNPDDDVPEMFCPVCGKPVTEDTQMCPHCGDWITPVDRPSGGGWRRRVFVAAVVVMILLTLLLMCPISIPVPQPR